MTTPVSTALYLSIPYWPSSSGLYWWERVRRDEVARDFELAAALHLCRLTISLSWHDFQPDPDRVALGAMRSLETVLTVADDYGLRLTVVLFPVKLGNLLLAPTWALGDAAGEGGRVLSGHHVSRRPLRNLFGDPTMLGAEVFLLREVVGSFTGHPAVDGWVIGDRLAAAGPPSGSQGFEEWIGTLAESARGAGGREPLWHAVSARDLIQSSALSPEVLASRGIGLRVAEDWRPPWALREEAVWPAFLATYATCLGNMPAVVTALGSCTREEASGLTPEARDARASERVERAAPLIQEMGGGGCEGAFLFDFSRSLAAAPPFDAEPHLLTCGCLYPDGTSKRSGRVWTDLFAAGLKVRPVPDGFSAPEPEARRAHPEAAARESFEAFAA